MYVTVEGYVLALAKVKRFDEAQIVRCYVKFSSDYDARTETFDKDIKKITIEDVAYPDEYDVVTVHGFIEGDSEVTEILQVFDWKVEIE